MLLGEMPVKDLQRCREQKHIVHMVILMIYSTPILDTMVGEVANVVED